MAIPPCYRVSAMTAAAPRDAAAATAAAAAACWHLHHRTMLVAAD